MRTDTKSKPSGQLGGCDEQDTHLPDVEEPSAHPLRGITDNILQGPLYNVLVHLRLFMGRNKIDM